jgi:integrase
MIQAPGMPRKRSSKLTIAGPLWPLRDIPLIDFSAEMLIDWIKAENKIRPTQAALANRLLFACLRWCWEARDNKQKVYALDNPEALRTKSYVKRVQTTKAGNHGSLGRDQLAVWFKEVRRIQNPVVSAFLQSCLLTGARPWQELAKLRWADVDFRWRRMKLHDKATSEGAQEGFRIIPLTPYVASLISGLPRRNEFVFSGTAGNDHLVDIRKSYHPALSAAGLDGPTVYGLRGSFATLAEYDDDVAPPAGVIAQIMGHTPSATAEKHYKKREIDSLYQWHAKIEGWILAQAGIDQPAETDKPNRLHVVGGSQ